MSRQEIHHNTPEQIVGYLRTAVDAVDEAGVPDDLRPAAFAKAVDLAAAKAVTLGSPIVAGLPAGRGF